MERLSMMNDRYSVEVEVRADRVIRVDCFQFLAEVARSGKQQGESIPVPEFSAMVRSAIGPDADGLSENELYSLGRRVMGYLERLGKD